MKARWLTLTGKRELTLAALHGNRAREVSPTASKIAWLAVVVDSFVGPILFRRALQRELESVELRRS